MLAECIEKVPDKKDRSEKKVRSEYPVEDLAVNLLVTSVTSILNSIYWVYNKLNSGERE